MTAINFQSPKLIDDGTMPEFRIARVGITQIGKVYEVVCADDETDLQRGSPFARR
jgi:hypothetical protein